MICPCFRSKGLPLCLWAAALPGLHSSQRNGRRAAVLVTFRLTAVPSGRAGLVLHGRRKVEAERWGVQASTLGTLTTFLRLRHWTVKVSAFLLIRLITSFACAGLSLLDREFIKLLSMEESSEACKVEDGTGARDGRTDLLDSLIMEDLHASLKHSKDEDVPCLSNLMKLLEMKSPSPVHGKRPITKITSKLSSSIALQLTALLDQDVALRFLGQFGHVEYKVPPSSHPPRIPLDFPLPLPVRHAPPWLRPGRPPARFRPTQWRQIEHGECVLPDPCVGEGEGKVGEDANHEVSSIEVCLSSVQQDAVQTDRRQNISVGKTG